MRTDWKDFSSEEKIAFLENIVTYDEAKELTRRLSAKKRRAAKKELVHFCPKCLHKYTELYCTKNEPILYRKQCNYCGFKGYPSSSKNGVIREWNNAIADHLASHYRYIPSRDDWYKL